MNNNITEDYCSFEVSKMLKEKEFNNPSTGLYSVGNNFYPEGTFHFSRPHPFTQEDYSLLEQDNKTIPVYILAPTHALAIKWIRENFKIQISIDYNYGTKLWDFTILFLEDSRKTYDLIDEFSHTEPEFDSPQEATEAALLYTLKHLI